MSIIGLTVITTSFISCKKNININGHIDKNAPLKMSIHEKDSLNGLSSSHIFEIPVNSIKYRSFVEWCSKNTEGWKSTPASYVAHISITQNNFWLLIFSKGNGVVIGFTDNNGKQRQYSKAINNEELNFLTK